MLELLNLVTSTLGSLALCPCPSSTLPATFPCHSINHLHQFAPHPTLSISVSTPPLSTSTSPVAPAPIPSPNVSNPTARHSSTQQSHSGPSRTSSRILYHPMSPTNGHSNCSIWTEERPPPIFVRFFHFNSHRHRIRLSCVRLGEHYDSHDVQMGTAGDCQRQRPPTKIFSWGADALVRMQLYCILGTKPSGRILRLPIRVLIRPLFGLLLEMFCSALTAG